MLTAPIEQKVILSGVSWETYQRLLADYTDVSGTHFIYDEGMLEIMVMSRRHEEPNRTLDYLVNVLAEEFDIDIYAIGSTTFQREDLHKGFEPDSAYYIGRGPEFEESDSDAATDPPPDLMIEVDVTSPSLNRFPLYAAFGVAEVWRYAKSRVHMYVLKGGQYAEVASSAAFPPLTAETATRFMDERRRLRSTQWVRQVRKWARQQR